MYKKVEALNNFVDMENDILNFWSENEIVQKNFDLNKDGEYFTFYDGPPTANGKPHMGHVLTRVIKDTIPRYKTMKGYNVLRKGGLDTHGLPVELEVEKMLGISGKKDIEVFGVENFTRQCKESVDKYSSMWKDMSHKVGYWVDMDNPYVTYHNSYIESVWWALKQMWNKELLYKGHKVLPYCPRCGTTLSTHEVGQGYKDVRDDSTIAKFKVKYEENKYILAWTTTPWTLPSNMALTVNKKYDYIEVKVGEETFLLAKELASKVLEDTTYETLREFKGAELLGLEYEPLFNFVEVEGKAHVVIHGDFVTLSDGTGIVHTAPAYGEDDNLVCNQNGIGLINLVDPEGKFLDCVTPWAGMNVKEANPKILAFMKENKMLFKTEKYLHSYPHCWRCDTPLLYYPRESWFVQTTALKDKLIENKNKINWYPDNVRTGRFADFLENLRDWGISRDRYWGTPLPIWECECGHRECVGSIEELKNKGIDVPNNIELHKPYIDNVKLKCEHCGSEMVRVKEVIDCWFDSGSMAFAQHHYPFENKEVFEANFPAQFISEAIDQTRGWFYTSLVIATVLFEKVPFENCIVLGHVLDREGVKMSKHKGNIVEPFELLESYGADATRWYFYTVNAPWLSKKFANEDVAGYQRKFLGTLWNVYSFYVLYADLDKFDPTKYEDFVSDNLMDKWIVSKLNGLVKTADEALEAYNITTATLELENFVDDLSNWYVRRNRSRFWNESLSEDKIGAYVTLYRVLVTLTKVAAPFVPFMTEEIYRNLVVSLDKNAPESVHLCRFPVCNESLIDLKLEERMDMAYKIVKLGRAARNEANIKNRQPLSKMLISTKDLPHYYGEIIKDELNIKEIALGYDLSDYVEFKIKPNLPVLGKKYGKLIPAIRNFINEQNQMQLAQVLRSRQTVITDVHGEKVELNSENLLVTMEGLEGYAFAGELSVGVVLDTRVTETLKEEGDLREIISKVQNMRKEKGFEVLDNITLYVKGTDRVINVVNKFLETIMKETLTSEIVYDKNVKYSECNINGEALWLFLEKNR